MNKKLTKLFAASAAALTLGAVVAPAVSAVEVPKYTVEEAKEKIAAYTAAYNSLWPLVKQAEANVKAAQAAVDAAKETKEAKAGELKAAKEALEAAKADLAAKEAAFKKADDALKGYNGAYKAKEKEINETYKAEEKAAMDKEAAAVKAATDAVAAAKEAEVAAGDALAKAEEVVAELSKAGVTGEDAKLTEAQADRDNKFNAYATSVAALKEANNTLAQTQTDAAETRSQELKAATEKRDTALTNIQYDADKKDGRDETPERKALEDAHKKAADELATAKETAKKETAAVPTAENALKEAEHAINVKEAAAYAARSHESKLRADLSDTTAKLLKVLAQQGKKVADGGVQVSNEILEYLKASESKGVERVEKEKADFEQASKDFAAAENAKYEKDGVKPAEVEKAKADAAKKNEKPADKAKEEKKETPKAEKKAEAKPAAKSEGKELPKTGEETAMVVIGAGLVATIAGGALVVSNRKKA